MAAALQVVPKTSRKILVGVYLTPDARKWLQRAAAHVAIRDGNRISQSAIMEYLVLRAAAQPDLDVTFPLPRR